MNSIHCARVVAAVLVIGLVAPSVQAEECAPSGSETSAVVGTVLGAVVGGLLGSRIGSGDGSKIAIGAGVLAGGFLGNKIGASMTCEDKTYHEETTQNALETQSVGQVSSWTNPDSGHEGSITPVKTYQQDDGKYCREFEQTVLVDGREERGTGTACRDEDGTWRMQSA
jgi:surface antigen